MSKTASQKQAAAFWRAKRSGEVEAMCEQCGLKYKWLTPYQLRIEDMLDVFPTNGRWHHIPSGKRGSFHTDADLFAVLESISDL